MRADALDCADAERPPAAAGHAAQRRQPLAVHHHRYDRSAARGVSRFSCLYNSVSRTRNNWK